MQTLLGRRLVGDLLPALVAGLRRLLARLLESVAFGVDHFAQPLGDVFVHTAEVVTLELVAPAPAQLLEHLADAVDAFAVGVAHAGLQQAAQRGVQVAVVQQVVGDLIEDVVGAELEPGLRPIPAAVPEASHI